MRNETFLREVAKTAEVGVVTPKLYEFFKEHLAVAPVRQFSDFYVINNFIPPFPSKAFDTFLGTFFAEESARPPIHTVDVAVTNACIFNCYHCYNTRRVVRDLPTSAVRKIVSDLCELGAVVMCLTGGEPCLRADLPAICRALPDDCAGVLSTTGYNFTEELARELKETGIYAIALSLDSAEEEEHDRKRGKAGAFKIALEGIERSLRHGFYTYVCTVPTKTSLAPEQFYRLLDLAERMGVPELQIIEPAPSGRLLRAGAANFGPDDVDRVHEYMREVNQRETGPIVTAFSHIESGEAFGCGAGTSHIYVDGTGEVSPCNMLPVTYGNAAKESLRDIIARMQRRFSSPCTECLAHGLKDFFRENAPGRLPAPAGELPEIPKLACEQELPRVFQLLNDRRAERAGDLELRDGYTSASETYDGYWLTIAGSPIDEMFQRFPAVPGGRALDCGCGTGYATGKLLEKTHPNGTILGVDLSPGMIEKARARVRGARASDRVSFTVGNALDALRSQPEGSFDVVTMTWLIGYVSCEESFSLIRRVLKPGGLVGFVAHLDRSPRVPIEEFEALAQEHPGSFDKYVEFVFPADAEEVSGHLTAAGLEPVVLQEGTFDFVCTTGQEVYDHVVKSGAGTTYWLALKPRERDRFVRRFVDRIDERFAADRTITIEHAYVLGIARAA